MDNFEIFYQSLDYSKKILLNIILDDTKSMFLNFRRANLERGRLDADAVFSSLSKIKNNLCQIECTGITVQYIFRGLQYKKTKISFEQLEKFINYVNKVLALKAEYFSNGELDKILTIFK